MSIHDGHRERLKERFLREGLFGFDDHQVLELVLFYCIPRRDTNEIAHYLLKEFGTLDKVIKAPLSELVRVEGIGKNAAIFLNLLRDFAGRCSVSRERMKVTLPTSYDCGEYLLPIFETMRNETVVLICMDARCKVLDCKVISEGSINFVTFPIRRIVELVIASNASSVVLAHNHPSGMVLPSADDINQPLQLREHLGL